MNQNRDNSAEKRKGERGAALVMALLISFLLMTASAGLILSASMNSANVTDATAEQQAYNAAESGIQAVVNVLRYKCTEEVSLAGGCKVRPNPLIDTAQPEYNKINRISYVKALTAVTSNDAADASGTSRLSRWMTYTGTGATDPVKIAQPSIAYDPVTGYGYSVAITDPDNTGTVVSYRTSGFFYEHDEFVRSQITYGTAPNQVIIRYVPAVVNNLDVGDAAWAATNFGTFNVEITGNGAQIQVHNRFEIRVRMSVPYSASRTIRGFIKTNTNPNSPPEVIFDSQTYNLRGTDFELGIAGFAMRMTGARPYGYEGNMAMGANVLTGRIAAPEPDRLLVRSTGYGPRGARKLLEAIIQSNYFSGMGAPATITMVGPPSASNGNFLFDPGDSNAMLYTGEDTAAGSTDIIPPIGTTNPVEPGEEDENLQHVLDAVDGHIANNVQGVPTNVHAEIPEWMESPQAMEQTVQELYSQALDAVDPETGEDRFFADGEQPTSWGDNETATGITFCDGDCELGNNQSGGGLLIVTGTLTLRGNFSWNGLIIVTGPGGVIRDGGGTGEIRGNIVVAPYENSQIGDGEDPPEGQDFLAPRWDTQGGGNSDIRYNSDNQLSGLGAISNVVLGVVEK